MERKLVYTTQTGLKIYSSDLCDNLIFNEIFVFNEYGAAIKALVSLPFDKPRVILDLGAHRGFFTFYTINSLRHAGQDHYIYAVEGSRDNYEEFLERLTNGNQGGHWVTSEIMILNGLVGLREGVEKFIIQDPYHTCNFAMKATRDIIWAENSPALREEIVAYVDIDKLVPEGPIDLIKLDVEGSEEDFLVTYQELLKRTSILVVEFHPVMCDMEACREAIVGAGFNVNVELDRKGVELFTR